MKRVYLVRHAESTANRARVHGGSEHRLTERGRAQARFVAERFAKLPVEALLASDYIRVQETAKAIAERTGLALETTEDLREVRLPSQLMEQQIDQAEAIETETKLIESMAPGYKHSDEETFDEMVARAGRMLDRLSRMPQQHIGLVTHGLFLRCLAGRAIFGADITPRELLALWRGLRTENTGLTILDYRPDTPKALWRIFTWNDHAHLG
jgi:probable phosphoglycerate mutase